MKVHGERAQMGWVVGRRSGEIALQGGTRGGKKIKRVLSETTRGQMRVVRSDELLMVL